MTFLKNKRIEVWVLLLLGAVTLTIGAGIKWWNLYNTPQPAVFGIVRMIILLSCVFCLIGLWKPSMRRLTIAVAGFSGVILPFISLLLISLSSPSTTYQAIQSNVNAEMLLRDLKANDFSPYISWKDVPVLSVDRHLLDNQFNVFDACEALSYCLSPGWYLCIFGGLLLIAAIWCLGRAETRLISNKVLIAYGAVVAVIVLYCGCCIGISALYWNKARTAHAGGQYQTALDYDRLAVKWDKRLDYDIAYHYELGELIK